MKQFKLQTTKVTNKYFISESHYSLYIMKKSKMIAVLNEFNFKDL